MAFTLAAADAMFACNSSHLPEVALDIFEAAIASMLCKSERGYDRLSCGEVVFVFNAALDAYRRQGAPLSALSLLERMENEHGVAPDIASYVTVLSPCKGRMCRHLPSSIHLPPQFTSFLPLSPQTHNMYMRMSRANSHNQIRDRA